MCLPGERVLEPVVDHRVERLRVTHPVAEARVRKQVRRARHALHAARDAGLEVARAHRLVEDRDGADARCADLVHGLGGHVLRDPALDLRLARGDLALPRLEHLAHHDLLDLIGLDVRALERAGDRLAAEVGGVEARERASELAERRAGGAEDHGLWHLVKPRFSRWAGR